MRVKASIKEDYVYQPEYGELQQLNALFPGVLVLTAEGYTYTAYQQTPRFLIKGNIYNGVATAEKTRSFDTKQAALHALKLGIELMGGKILNVSNGLYLPGKGVGGNPFGVMADHIPQLYALYPTQSIKDRVCVSVNGNFNLTTRTFTGQMAFASLGDLWKEQ